MTADPDGDPPVVIPDLFPRNTHCNLCDWESRVWPTTAQAESEAAWHVYEEHRQTWVRVIGDRPPRNADPRKEPQL